MAEAWNSPEVQEHICHRSWRGMGVKGQKLEAGSSSWVLPWMKKQGRARNSAWRSPSEYERLTRDGQGRGVGGLGWGVGVGVGGVLGSGHSSLPWDVDAG